MPTWKRSALSLWVATLALILAQAPAYSASKSGNSVIESDCSRLLTEEQFLAKHIADSSADLTRLFAHVEEQARTWKTLLNGKAPTAKVVHVLHQTRIKQLNEESWHMTGTEEYLETFHDLLHQFLRANPELGAVLHNDYKNHFVLSSLGKAEFKSRVVEPVIERLASRMNERHSDLDWTKWINETVFHGSGTSPAEAYFRAGLAKAVFQQHPSDLDINTWRVRAIQRRAMLVTTAAVRGVKWETILAMLHSYVNRGPRKERVLKRWLDLNNASELLRPMQEYYDDLQIADFQPLSESPNVGASAEEFLALKRANPVSGARTSWTIERRALFLAAKDSSHVVVTDIRKLGSIARRFQDEWISNGAQLPELQNVYAQSTEALEVVFAETYLKLKAILGKDSKIHVYRSGDDGVWLLPEMTGEQLGSVREIFKDLGETGREHATLSLKLHYSSVVPIDHTRPANDAIAEAFMKARYSLTSAKKIKTPKRPVRAP